MRIFPLKISILAAIFVVGGLGSSEATVTLDFQLGWNPAAPAGSTAILVADTDPGDRDFAGIDTPTSDLLGLSLTVGTVFGGDDLILAVFAADLNIGLDPEKGISLLLAGYTLPAGVNEGDHLAIYWFDGPSPTDPVELNQTGGFYRTDVADVNSGATSGFLVPADGTSKQNFYAFSSTINGATTVPDSDFTANDFTVIPEPSAAVLGVAAFGVLLLRRRRR